MNIQQFQYVLAVVDQHNFESAAEQCYVTQSTLSTMIGRFEEEIGIKIFNRKTKPVTVTDEGEKVIQHLRIILHEIDDLNNTVQEMKGEVNGSIKIGVIPTIAPYLLPLFLGDYTRRFPKVKVVIKELTTGQIKAALKVRSIDLGILALPLLDRSLQEFELYTEPFMVYDRSEGKQPDLVKMEDLDYTKLFLLQEGHCLRTQVKKICDLSNQMPKEAANFEFESGSMDSLIHITQSQKGMTLLPFLATTRLSKEEQLNLIEFEAPVPARTVGIVTNRFFVKRSLLEGLKESIQNVVQPLLPQTQKQQLIDP